MNYPIAETFYSLKGEGEWTGAAMFFIRLSDCNLRCNFCDTNYNKDHEASIDELVAEALTYPTKKVVITGGEPCMYDTQPLVVALHQAGFKCHLETNCTLPTHYDWDWIAASPKSEELNSGTLLKANEVKFICGIPSWKEYMETTMKLYHFNMEKNDAPVTWLMPLAKAWPHRVYDSLLEHNMQAAVAYCLGHPRVKFCIQMHKCVGIK